MVRYWESVLMHVLLDRLKRWVLRLNPDRLWLQCCLVLGFMLAVLVAMHAVNQSIINRSFGVIDSARLAALHYQQWLVLAVSVTALLAAGLVILLPAQFVVRHHIAELRRQTTTLRQSALELELANAQLAHLAHHDPLTGLPNRGRLISTLTKSISRGQAAGHCFLLIGLDGFKAVNDNAGHAVGDDLLIAVGHALHACVDDDQIAARIGGDEFAIFSDEPPSEMVRRVMAALAEPVVVHGRRIKVNASIGYLVIGQGRVDAVDILADAALALQTAKGMGGHRAQLFTDTMRDDAGLLHRLQLELPEAIRNGELEPWFQPQVRLSDGRLHGVEVLARWRHPTRGLLTPDRFLPVAERAGLMIEMDHAIWQSAMAHAFDWQQTNLWRPLISLNAAPDTIADPYLIERFLLGLQKSGLDADQVIVEVLETTLINSASDMAAINIDSLAECGIALELDDFGTGYASLAKLTQLPLSGIKLDRSLVAPLPDQGADSIVRAILALASELGLHVVAEGIEDSGQARHLVDRGCAVGQGYGFARPMPAGEFQLWLHQYAKTVLIVTDDPPALVKQG
jgi:diguanylate cyclase (GGDEF)-like protein